MYSASRKKGFTLIELLVVIAIIAILAAILFPVFAKAREKARQSQCMSNLKNCALALRMYSSDYDERLPFGLPRGVNGVCPTAPAGNGGWCNGVASSPTGIATTATYCNTDYSCGWPWEAQAYIKNTQVLLCPNWNKVTLVGVQGGAVNGSLQGQFFVSTYSLSSSLVGAAESEIANAANKAMLYEILPFHHDITVTTAARLDQNFNNAQAAGQPGWKSGAIVIVGFADGHTKVVNMNQSLGHTGTSGAAQNTLACGANRSGCMENIILTGGNAGQTCTNSVVATKWNLNAGWDPATNFAGACNNTLNPSPLALTGRQGSNF